MHYIPNLPNKSEMLSQMGLNDIDELFSDIPKEVRINGLSLPDGLSELEVQRHIKTLASRNSNASSDLFFLGAGIYNHFVPPAVSAILQRSEFYTAYTPYQPEISQGMLQTMFEYQSHIAELTGLDVANSSMYDAATALGEAARMSMRITRKKRLLVPEGLSSDRMSVLQNYTDGAGMTIDTIPINRETGQHDLSAIEQALDDDTAGVYIESPNSFGVLEECLPDIKEVIGDKVMLIVGVNPISLGILEGPGSYGADIVVGEGQSLGIPMSYGGPLLGIFATRKKYVRHMPGRLIGLTKDRNGKRAYVMTMQTREQHIRREKATSNICSNEALMAVASAVYVSLMGPEGLKKVANISMARAHYMYDRLMEIDGIEPVFSGPFFNEFAMNVDTDIPGLLDKLTSRGLHLGVEVETPDGENIILTAVTEMNSMEDIDSAVNITSTVLKEVLQ